MARVEQLASIGLVGSDGALRPRWLYFVGMLMLSGQGRFLSLMLESFNLSDAEIGIISSLPRSLNAVAPLIWGLLADRALGREAAMCASAGSAALAFGLLYYPHLQSFENVLVIRTTHGVLLSGFASLADSYCLAHVLPALPPGAQDDSMDRKKLYGRERLWGAISWALGSLLLGYLFDVFDTYLLMIPFYIITSIVTIVAIMASVLSQYLVSNAGTYAKVDVEDPGSPDVGIELAGLSHDEIKSENHLASRVEDERTSTREETGSLASGYASHHPVLPQILATDEAEEIPAVVFSASETPDDAGTIADAAPIDDNGIEKERAVTLEGVAQTTLEDLSTREKVRAFGHVACCNVPNLTFFLTLAVASAGVSLVENLSFIFFKDDIGTSNFVMGISVCVTVSFEIPLFALGNSLISRFAPQTLLFWGLLAYSLRVFAYTLVPKDHGYLILLCEPLHGVTYALIQLASVLIVSDMAPAGLESFAQSSIMACRSIGTSLGLVVGSAVMESYGAAVMYRGASVVVLLMAFIYYVLAVSTVRERSHEGLQN
ncbi:Major facilitator superfamily domain-containing protein 6 [Hondaea fermentalgiana]|uniref:Major facilitator superfamily domain-containing protein 6 n=1 Tax=Hondaea fermentalgiana TaxID=2315210 RepID=A0A2R5GTN4_9STRA|nr:Major facilitator superfamily domain-containing protein 6 [Hondaea fermentalgiana]|eukprot:GBG33935.1 Major facilitator superfamily domain-containing protein 6 [Hondaea fermentalgiana]